MPDREAQIIVGASPVAAGRRHTYLLFEYSDGRHVVVRGGPDARSEGNDLANLAGSTLLGSENFGKIRVDAAPYVAPYEAAYRRQKDGSIEPVPIGQVRDDDTSIIRDKHGKPVVQMQQAPDWPLPGEHHERLAVWKGSDADLEKKLGAALRTGQQINDARLEYSPLYNNSNGVASTLLQAAGVKPALPNGADGKPVDAPNFGEDLHQNVGPLGHKSGYWLDHGRQWRDGDDRRIEPPKSGQPVVPLDPREPKKGSGPGLSMNDGAGDAAVPALAADDRRFFDDLRGRMPVGYNDDQVMAAMVDAKKLGFTGPENIEKTTATPEAFFMRGDHTTGYGTVKVALDQPQPDRQQLESENQALNQQRDQARTAQQQQVPQPAHSGPALA